MSKLVSTDPSMVLGASSNLAVRYLKQPGRNGSFRPGEWETLSLNCSPVGSLKPGNSTSVEYIFPQGTEKRVESMLYRFDVVNAHATDNLRTVSPWNFVGRIVVHVNGAEFGRWTTEELKLLQSEYLQTRCHDMSAVYGKLARMRQAYDGGSGAAGTPENYPAQATTEVVLDLEQVFSPLIENMVIHTGQRIRRLRFEITFQTSLGSTDDGNHFINSTAAAALWNSTNITFDNCRLEMNLAEITSALLLKAPSPLFPMTKFHSTYWDMDLSLAATTKVVRIGQDLPKEALIYRIYAIVEDRGAVTTYNDADGSGLRFSGPQYLRCKMKRTGAVTEMDLTATTDAIRWFIQMHRFATGRMPGQELYDGAGGDIVENWMPLPIWDFRTLENNQASHELTTQVIGGANTLSGDDYTLTINAAADALYSANARLHVFLAYTDLVSISEAGTIIRQKAKEAL